MAGNAPQVSAVGINERTESPDRRRMATNNAAMEVPNEGIGGGGTRLTDWLVADINGQVESPDGR